MLASQVDVLIIGAGPAGSLLSFALARAGINVRIVDKRLVSLANHSILYFIEH
jgi:phenol 2-monooxygenase